jgi:hypothetical protein
MIHINFDRLKCIYCFSIDGIAFALLFLAFTNPIYDLPAAFAFGFSYVGMGYEAVFQADHYNFFSSATLQIIHTIYWLLFFLFFILFFFTGYAAPFAFLAAAVFMELINRIRYPLESPIIFDMVILIPFVLGTIGLFLLG